MIGWRFENVITFENVGSAPSEELTFSLSHGGSMVDILTENIILESVAAGDWPPNTSDMMLYQENKILIPSNFSPLH